MKAHVCLVSAQAAANLLPALDPALKPAKAVLVVTGKMQAQANHLEAVLKENGIKVAQLRLENEHNFHRIQNELIELAAKLESDEVSLNMTGGTKLMSVAAQSVADVGGWRMFYVDADTDQAIWLDKTTDTPAHPLHEQLKLRHYLRSYGFSLSEKPRHPHVRPEQQDLLRTLSTQIGSLQDALGTLNYLAQIAENEGRLSVQLDKWQLDSRSLEALLRHFEDANSLKLQGDTLRFTSEADRDFVKGGWLELHAMQALQQISGELGIRDKSIGLEVMDEASGTKNELDVAFMTRNRLFVVECKTARIDKPAGNARNPAPPKANDTLFKLAENCRRIGGLGTRGMLLSYRDLNTPELRLAHALNIAVVSGGEIASLPEKLKNWITPKH
ncbi:MAG: DUF1887 family CARF protein [Pseudoxanthomonas sp.]